MKRLVLSIVWLSACSTTSLNEHLAKDECEQAENMSKIDDDQRKQISDIYALTNKYVVTPSSYVIGYSLVAITVPIYVMGSLVAVPAHDLANAAHKSGIYPVYRFSLSNAIVIKGVGITAQYQGRSDIDFYSEYAGPLPFLHHILREPLTTQRWREFTPSFASRRRHQLYADQMLVGQCYANRAQAGDLEKSLAILQRFENDSQAPSYLEFSYGVRDAYRQLKSLENPQWAIENPKTYGPTHQGLGLQLRGIFADEESQLAH